nr:hypothetical protein [Tanacetum cinerariifolium]
MLRLQGLGSNTPSGVPNTEDEVMAIVRGASNVGTFPVLVRFCRNKARSFPHLLYLESQPEYGGGSGSGGCGDDEDGREDGEDEDDKVLVEEMDSLMVQFGYEAGKTNYYYFLKHGSNLIDDLYDFRKIVNYELLKDLVNEHKMIDIYVENGKTRLEISEMSPNSIMTVFREMDEDSRKVASATISSCCKQLVLGDVVDELMLEPFSQVTQLYLKVNSVGQSRQFSELKLCF